MKGLTGPVLWLIFLAAGTGLTAMLYYIFWEQILVITSGACHSAIWAQTRELKSEINGNLLSARASPIEFRLSVGNCVEGIIIVNDRNDPEYGKTIRSSCNTGFLGHESFLLTMMSDGDVICREFDRKFSTSGLTALPRNYPEEKNEGANDYCLRVSAVEVTGGTGGYSYLVNQVACSVKEE